MSRSSSPCRRVALLAWALASCASTPSAPPSPGITAAEAPRRPPGPPMEPSTLEVVDYDLGLVRPPTKLQMVGDPDPRWISDRHTLWDLAAAPPAGHAPPALATLPEARSDRFTVNTWSRGLLVGRGDEVLVLEGGRRLHRCELDGGVYHLAPLPDGGVLAMLDAKSAHLVALEPQGCRVRWRSELVSNPLVLHGGSTFAIRRKGDATSLVRLRLADGAELADLPLSGRPVSMMRQSGATAWLVTQGPGSNKAPGDLFFERIDLAGFKRDTVPLGVHPTAYGSIRHAFEVADDGLAVIAVHTLKGKLLFVEGGEVEALEFPEKRELEGINTTARLGSRVVVAAGSTLHFFDLPARRHLGGVDVGRPVKRLGVADGDLVVDGGSAPMLRLRSSSGAPAAKASVAYVRATPFHHGEVAALTDGSVDTAFAFLDAARIDVVFARPVVLRRFALDPGFQAQEEIVPRVEEVKWCRDEFDDGSCRSDRSPKPGEGGALLEAPVLVKRVTVRLRCRLPSGIASESDHRCRVAELALE